MEPFNCTDSPGYDDENYEKILTSMYESKVEPREDIRETILNEAETLKKSVAVENEELDCLKIEDEKSYDVFEQDSKYQEAVMKWISPSINSKLLMQLTENNLLSKYDDGNKLTTENEKVNRLSSIESMIEQTYFYSKDKRQIIAEEICYMRMLVFRWRKINGDGNCFYRSAMFSWLENIVLTCDVQMLQKLIVDIHIRFDGEYPNTRRLCKLIKSSITDLDRRLVITLLQIIMNVLDDFSLSKASRILKAYEFLLKSFNSSKTFDTAMIIYLRYMLYEFILANQNKIFSKDFPVKLGNLLPFQYETDDGEFLFDKFFVEELLKMYTYAEKLAIYLTPFVLKMNLRVIFYDYGVDCNIQTKDFPCYLQNKFTANILYRKAHYDIAYTQDYVLQYNTQLSIYSDFNDTLHVVSEKFIDQIQKTIDNVNIEQSKIFNRRDKNKPKTTEVNTKEKNNSLSSDDKNSAQNISQDITKESLEKELEDLKKQINEINVHEEKEEEDTTSIPLLQCENCHKTLKCMYPVRPLPCDCQSLNFCSSACIEEYSNTAIQIITTGLMQIPFLCSLCKKEYSTKDLISLSLAVESVYSPGIKTALLSQLEKMFQENCMICLTQVQGKRNVKVFKDREMPKFLNMSKFEHVVCESCIKLKSSDCKICGSHHLNVLTK